MIHAFFFAFFCYVALFCDNPNVLPNDCVDENVMKATSPPLRRKAVHIIYDLSVSAAGAVAVDFFLHLPLLP